MPPILAFDLSGVIIQDIRDYNLAHAVKTSSGMVREAQDEFPLLFGQLANKVAPLPEDEFWSRLAVAAVIRGSGGILRELFLSGFDFRPGMEDLLTTLRRMSVRTYIWTNMPNSWLEAMNNQLWLEDLVSGFVNGQNLHWRKPEPGFFQGALDRHGLDPDEVIYVGARKENLLAAKPFTSQQWQGLEPSKIDQRVRALLRVDRVGRQMTP